MNPLVSIIIPVYNTGRYIKKCVNSILSQSFQDFEIILVDDCSTDNSLTICQAFCRIGGKDNRITLISNKINQGCSKTRQIGTDAAKGKYIMFVDSDDFLDKYALQTLIEIAENNQCDVVALQMRRFIFCKLFSKPALTSPDYVNERLLEKPELDTLYKSYFGVNILPVNFFCKLYLRETWIKANIQPWPYFLGEDLMANLQLHPYIKRMYITSQIAYNYRYGGGTTTADYHKTIETAIAMYKERKQIAIANGHSECLHPLCIELKNYIKCAITACCTYRNNKMQSDISDFKEFLKDDCFNDFHSLNLNNPDPIDTAILNFDIEKAFDLSHKQNESRKMQIFVKKTIRKIASIF